VVEDHSQAAVVPGNEQAPDKAVLCIEEAEEEGHTDPVEAHMDFAEEYVGDVVRTVDLDKQVTDQRRDRKQVRLVEAAAAVGRLLAQEWEQGVDISH
jgi:hypothetical protein